MLMLGKFRQWLHDTFESRPQQRQKPRRGHRVLPRLEVLEAREVPATFNVDDAGELQAAILAAAKTSAAADVINIRVAEIDMSGFDAFVLTGKGGALTIRSVVGNSTIEQDGSDRIFLIEEGAKVTLSKLTITGGYADGDSFFIPNEDTKDGRINPGGATRRGLGPDRGLQRAALLGLGRIPALVDQAPGFAAAVGDHRLGRRPGARRHRPAEHRHHLRRGQLELQCVLGPAPDGRLLAE
jgi:hypothetical protein